MNKVDPNPNTPQYFLGIDGHQTGPLSQTEIVEKIQNQQIPHDALLWHEGLPDWQPLTSFDRFRKAFEGGGTSPEIPAAILSVPDPGAEALKVATASHNSWQPNQKGSKKSDGESGSPTRFPTFAENPARLGPVFKPDESSFATKNALNFAWKKPATIAGGALAAAIAIFVGMRSNDTTRAYLPSWMGGPDDVIAPIGKALPKKTPRGDLLNSALSKLLTSPDQAVPSLISIATDNSQDEPGKEAIRELVDYFRQRKRPKEAGDFLTKIGRYDEAMNYYLMEPYNYLEAEKAAFAAYKAAKEPENRKRFLRKDIELLIGPASNPDILVERIRLLEKEFPNDGSEFQFYTKNVDDRIAEVFQLVSFYFVQNLLNFVSTEIPQMSLMAEPVVSVKKDSKGYRVVGNYKGEVNLSREKLSNIYIVFWWGRDSWHIIETNLTPERQKWAKLEKAKREADFLPAQGMFEFLQNLFKQQFPNQSLHSGSRNTASDRSKDSKKSPTTRTHKPNDEI